MTEVLGEAVLDLTADISDLQRKLAEADALSKATTDDISKQWAGVDTSFRDVAGSLSYFDNTLQRIRSNVPALTTTMTALVAANTAGVRSFDQLAGAADRALSSTALVVHELKAEADAADEAADAFARLKAAQALLGTSVNRDLFQAAGFGLPQRGGPTDLGPGLQPLAPQQEQLLLTQRAETHNDFVMLGERTTLLSRSMDSLRGIIAGIGQRIGSPYLRVAGGGAGGGGGGGTNVIVTGGGDGGGGGGRGGLGSIISGAALSRLLWGGGGRIGGIGWLPTLGVGAGMGSLGALAGFGPEHVLMTGLGLAGSAGTAAVGGGLLGLGAAGQFAVGGGSDIAVLKSTIADTQTLSQALQEVQKQTAIYGAGSRQAAVATAQLNQQMVALGNTAGVRAELGLAKATDALNTFWDKATSQARVQAVNILMQVVKLGTDYVPRVAAAAQTNLAIVNNSIKPLFDWLEGPHGIQIWNDLENRFRQNIPAAMDAFNNAVELLLKITDDASAHLTGFITKIDEFIRHLNQKPDSTLNDWVSKMVGDFRIWLNFFKALGTAIYDLFRQDAGTGQTIIVTLTAMLDKLAAWERSTQGAAAIHNLFEVHLQEVKALLAILPSLLTSLGRFYLSVAPALTNAASGILNVFATILNDIVQLGHASPILENALVLPLGAFLVGGKLFGLKATLDGVAVAARALGGDAVIGALTRFFGAVGGGTAGAGGAGQQLGLFATGGAKEVEQNAEKVGTSLKTGVIRGLGIASIGTLLAQGIGDSVKGEAGSIISTVGSWASVGAGAGSMFGPWGAAAGAALGAGISGAVELFQHSAPDDGKKWAQSFTASLPAEFSNALTQGQKDALAKGRDELAKYITQAQQLAQQGAVPARGQGPTGGITPRGRGPNIYGQMFEQASQLSSQQLEVARKAGEAFGNQVVNGLASVKFPTALLLERGFQTELNRVPADIQKLGPAAVREFQDVAAQGMIAYAQGLERNGKLPRGQVDLIIRDLEGKFSGLKQYLDQNSAGSAAAIAQHFKFTQALSNVENFLKQYAAQWGDTQVALLLSQKQTDATRLETERTALENLRLLSKDKNKTIADEATAEYKRMQTAIAGSYTQMVADTRTKLNTMSALVQSGSATQAQYAIQAYQNEVTQIGKAEAANVLNVNTAMSLMVQATNDLLKTFGVKPVPVPLLRQMTPKDLQLLATTPQGRSAAANWGGSTYQSGGLMQVGPAGARGPDNIPLNVGGTPIVVGAGEQVAVFNAAQQKSMDKMLAGMGGLQGFFEGRSWPAHAKGYQGGGYVFPFGRGASWGRTDQGVDFSGSGPIGAIGDATVTYSNPSDGWYPPRPAFMVYQLTSGPDAGKYVYVAEGIANLAPAGSRVKAGQAIAQMTDGIEMGWAAGPRGHQIIMPMNASHYTAEGQQFHDFLTGLTHGQIIGGPTGMSMATIPTPQVTGTGPLATVDRAALSDIANAANAYVGAHAVGSASSLGAPGAAGTIGTGWTGPWTQVMAQIAQKRGWNLDDWKWIVQAESGGNPAAVNPSSGAFGLGQFLGATLQAYARYGASSHDPVMQIEAMAQYIADRYGNPTLARAFHESHNWYGAGGITHTTRTTRPLGTSRARKPPVALPKSTKGRSPAAPKTVKHATTKAGKALPKFRNLAAGSLPGPLQTLYNQIQAMDTAAQDEIGWMGYLQSLHGMAGTQAIITDADGNQQVNWGDPNGVLGILTGLPDPQTGMPTKGIYDRIREITGSALGSPPATFPGLPPFNQNTELGVDSNILYDYLQEQTLVGKFTKQFGPWFAKLVQTIKNVNARINRTTQSEAGLAPRQSNEDYQITRRYQIQRAGINANARVRSFDITQQRANVLAALQADENTAIGGVPVHPPASFLGDTSSWFIQRDLERAAIHNQYAEQRRAIAEEAAAKNLSGRQSRSAALLALSLQEGAEKQALKNSITKQRTDDKNLIQGLKNLLNGKAPSSTTGLQATYNAVTASGGTLDTLAAWNDPHGQLTLNILDYQNINIPGLLNERLQLLGEAATQGSVGAAPTATDQAMIDLLTQQVAQLAQAYAVSQAQLSVLANYPMPPFGGSFQYGGVVPGPLGEARTVIAHAGETITPPTVSSGGDVHLYFSDSTAYLKDFVRGEVEDATRGMARRAARMMPARGGGLLVNR